MLSNFFSYYPPPQPQRRPLTLPSFSCLFSPHFPSSLFFLMTSHLSTFFFFHLKISHLPSFPHPSLSLLTYSFPSILFHTLLRLYPSLCLVTSSTSFALSLHHLTFFHIVSSRSCYLPYTIYPMPFLMPIPHTPSSLSFLMAVHLFHILPLHPPVLPPIPSFHLSAPPSFLPSVIPKFLLSYSFPTINFTHSFIPILPYGRSPHLSSYPPILPPIPSFLPTTTFLPALPRLPWSQLGSSSAWTTYREAPGGSPHAGDSGCRPQLEPRPAPPRPLPSPLLPALLPFFSPPRVKPLNLSSPWRLMHASFCLVFLYI